MSHSIHVDSRATLSSSARLLAAGTLVAVGLVLGVARVGADELPTLSPAESGVPSSTAVPTEVSVTPAPTQTTGTPGPSATPTPTPDPRLEKLGAALDGLEADLGDNLSDTTRARMADVKTQLSALLAFSAALGSGEIVPGEAAKHQLHQLVKSLQSSLRELRHDVQSDINSMAKGGGGGSVSEIRHDVNFLKKDLDGAVHEARQALEGKTESPGTPAVPTAQGSPTPEASEAKEPAEQAEAKEPAERPEAKEPAEQAEAKEPAERPEAKEPAERPEAKEHAERPEAKEPAERPEAKEHAERPKANKPAERPEGHDGRGSSGGGKGKK